MKVYSAIFFWFGGVLTASLPERTLAELMPGVKGNAVIPVRQNIRSLAGELTLGKITSQQFCQQAIAVCQSSLDAAELASRIIAAASLNESVTGLIAKIPATYERWLVVDYPADWYQELAARWKLDSLFQENRTVFSAELKLLRTIPEIFYLLPQKAGRAMDDCLVIDPESARSVEAMKHGLATIIYVYPERLKHELALQGIWQTEANVLHPAASERVSL
jgi:FMN phosphatase YigB (HAD superfamily)